MEQRGGIIFYRHDSIVNNIITLNAKNVSHTINFLQLSEWMSISRRNSLRVAKRFTAALVSQFFLNLESYSANAMVSTLYN